MCAPGPDAEPPTTGRLIDGKAVAKAIRGEIRESTEALVREHGVTPGLAVVLGVWTEPSEVMAFASRGIGWCHGGFQHLHSLHGFRMLGRDARGGAPHLWRRHAQSCSQVN